MSTGCFLFRFLAVAGALALFVYITIAPERTPLGGATYAGKYVTLVRYVDLLDELQCDALIREALDSGRLKQSKLQSTQLKGDVKRTSHGVVFARSEEMSDPLAEKAKQIIYEALREMSGRGESVVYEDMSVVRYQAGEEFTLHSDMFEKDSLEMRLTKNQQRHVSFLVYLNTVHGDNGGSETVFPDSDVAFPAQMGHALAWVNLREEGYKHLSMPVVEGEKWVAVAWSRKPVRDAAEL